MSEGDFVDAKRVALGGYLHLLQAPFGATAAIEHCPDLPFWSGVAAGAAQAQYWPGKEDDENQHDASTTHRALNSLIDNSKISMLSSGK